MKKDNLTLPHLIESLLSKALELGLLQERNTIYLRNQYYLLLAIKEHPQLITPMPSLSSLAEICAQIYRQLDKKLLEQLGETKEQVETRLINLLIPLPSFIEDEFNFLCQHGGIKLALDWYYNYSRNSNYIKVAEIAKTQRWSALSQYGTLEISLNQSKPEKDPLEIAKAKNHKPALNQYPQCMLCIENEGYAGSHSSPARHNHRMLRFWLNKQDWYFQYSPYLYYPEHSIIINARHQEMHISTATLAAFFDFVDLVPHYIIGSNSDIPIVGGSILNHDHFQAGNNIFPLENSRVKTSFSLPQFPALKINYLYWPVTTLQLRGTKSQLSTAFELISNSWYHYANPQIDIIAYSTKGERHNAITPIIRKVGADEYILYLMLRNNRTSAEHPEGIFHPQRKLHHIKKENIGLIEAMGLAILPGRLTYEIEELTKLMLLNDKNLAVTELLFDEQLLKHEHWLSELYEKYTTFNLSSIKKILEDEIALKFVQVLENAGVFKHNPAGDAAMANLLSQIMK